MDIRSEFSEGSEKLPNSALIRKKRFSGLDTKKPEE